MEVHVSTGAHSLSDVFVISASHCDKQGHPALRSQGVEESVPLLEASARQRPASEAIPLQAVHAGLVDEEAAAPSSDINVFLMLFWFIKGFGPQSPHQP